MDDRFTCKPINQSTSSFLVFSLRHELRLYDLHTKQEWLLSSALRNTIALDYYYNHTNDEYLLFWMDITTDQITSATLKDGALSNTSVIINQGADTPEGLAVDWLTYKIYWLDSSLDQIEVSDFWGQQRTTVMSGNMTNLRALALDAHQGLLFWCDWDEREPRIERATMAGKLRRVLVSVHKLEGAWPNGLTLDYVAKRVYWVDARSHSIHHIDYYGLEQPSLLLKSKEYLAHPFAVTVDHEFVYWTDWRLKAVLKANKWNGSAISIVLKSAAQPYDVKVLHPSRQMHMRSKQPCLIDNGGCEGLCLINSTTSRICACNNAQQLIHNHDTHCQKSSSALLYSAPDLISGLQLSTSHSMPVLSKGPWAQVHSLVMVQGTDTILWLDSHSQTIYSADVHGTNVLVLADQELAGADRLAVDWRTQLIYFTTCTTKRKYFNAEASLNVMQIDGTNRRSLIMSSFSNKTDAALKQPCCLVIDPINGYLYWFDKGYSPVRLYQSNLIGRKVTELVLTLAQTDVVRDLVVDVHSRTLFWMNNDHLMRYDITSAQTSNVTYLPQTSCLTIHVNLSREHVDNESSKLYLFDKSAMSVREHYIGSVIVSKNGTVSSVTVIHNLTETLSLTHYSGQVKPHIHAPCTGKLVTSGFCVPVGKSAQIVCAQGYSYVNESGKCVPSSKSVWYIDNLSHRIHCVADNASDNHDLFAPIPQSAFAGAIDLYHKDERIFWIDNQHNHIQSIKYDLTDRHTIYEGGSSKLLSLAVDWVGQNLFISSSSRSTSPFDSVIGSIQVSNLQGEYNQVIHLILNDTAHSLRVHATNGYIFWVQPKTGVYRHYLNVKTETGLCLKNMSETSSNISDLAIDVVNNRLFWVDQSLKQVVSVDMHGNNQMIALNFSIGPTSAISSIGIVNGKLYWYDSLLQGGTLSYASLNKDGSIVNRRQMHRHQLNMKVIDIVSAHNQLVNVKDNVCMEGEHSCAQLCLVSPTMNESTGAQLMAQCVCAFSQLADDSHKCKPYTEFLAMTTSTAIEFAQITSTESKQDVSKVPLQSISSVENMRNAVGLAVDVHNKLLFYSDFQLNKIFSVSFAKENEEPKVLVQDVSSVEGIVYDDVHGDLYWTSYASASITRKQLRAPNQSPNIIVQMDTRDKPRAIAIDTCELRIYWTNWNAEQPCIERSFTSGYGRHKLIMDKLHTPNALAIDHSLRRLYWADAHYDTIEYALLDGTGRKTLTKGAPSHAFSLVVFEQYVYVTDWVQRALLRVHKHTGGDLHVVRSNLNRQPMSVVVVAANATTSQCKYTECAQSKCMDQCLLYENGTSYCACSTPFVLAEDQLNCIERESVCDKDEFECSSDGKCIPYEFTCDRTHECTNGEDEAPILCRNRTVCREEYWPCGNGLCVPQNVLCDGNNDCGHYADETNKAGCTCTSLEWQCASGMCINATERCNALRDCNDASDEIHCKQGTSNCSAEMVGDQKMMSCAHTTACILPTWLCDGQNDCWDNWDELGCDTPIAKPLSCASSDFQCAASLRIGNTTACIPMAWHCDGDTDCVDGSDETNCGAPCQPQQFTCANQVQCIQSNWHCDGQPDCSDGSDELDCAESTNNVTCHVSTQFRCVTQHSCLPIAWRCDGTADCADKSDEFDCDTIVKVSSCGLDEFGCGNGLCILAQFYCDGHNDCADNTDEPSSCVSHESESNECSMSGGLLCVPNGKCVPARALCDGQVDCVDMSDETDLICDKVHKCKTTEYQCANRVCVSTDSICDKHNDCGDWSDERGCGVNECVTLNPCAHKCTDHVIGYKCSCQLGYTLHKDGHSCQPVSPCTSSPCAHYCTVKGTNHVCSCAIGYKLSTDNQSCKHANQEPVQVLVSSRYYLYLYELHGNQSSTLVHRLLTNLSNAVAVDYDHKTQMAYWTDVAHSHTRIGRIGLDKQPMSYKYFSWLDAEYADGLAVDWLGGNLYWTDKAHGSIHVANLQAQFTRLLHNSKLIQQPRALAVDPINSLLFYTDWGESAHIGRMRMDGSWVESIVTTSIRWPNALTLHPITQQIYWGDARLHIIDVCNYDGSGRHRVVSSVPHVFSLSVFDNWLYWTDWNTSAVHAVNKDRGLDAHLVIGAVPHRPMGLKVVHSLMQTQAIGVPNPCHLHPCDNLCLLTNSTDKGYICACADNFVLDTQGHCTPACKTWQFTCAHTYKCIPGWWQCDGQDDCGDAQDELYLQQDACPLFECSPGQWQCSLALSPTAGNQTRTCVNSDQLCDGHTDCANGDDEGHNTPLLDCATYECAEGQFKCLTSHICLPAIVRCDGHKHCLDASDELNCPPQENIECDARRTHKCEVNNRTVCLSSLFVCDGNSDCDDKSDENNCGAKSCLEKEFQCASGRCIPDVWHCDNQTDCSDNTDELNCEHMKGKCDKGKYFECVETGRCIDKRWQCDGAQDCTDWSDEWQSNCDGAAGNCTHDQFACADNQLCVPWAMRCDKRKDCLDGSDELKCGKIECGVGEWQCHNGVQCIAHRWLCDSHIDCDDGSDEWDLKHLGECSNECNVSSGMFHCSDGNCIAEEYLCDGWQDCSDDENQHQCALRPCAPGMSKCLSGVCFASHLACDGVSQCADQSDESALYCPNEHKCTKHTFLCANSRCVNRKYLCDGTDHCGDNSDEMNCDQEACLSAQCSQLCVLLEGQPKCICGQGFSLNEAGGCRADDAQTYLLRTTIAGRFYAERIADLSFKAQNTTKHEDLIPEEHAGANILTEAQWDASKNGWQLFVIVVDDLVKDTSNADWLLTTPLHLNLRLANHKRTTRQTENTISASDVSKVRVAYDWWQNLLYYTSTQLHSNTVIRVCNVLKDTSKHATVIDSNLHLVTALVVSPAHFRIFWADHGSSSTQPFTYGSKIESARSDGSDRKILISASVFYISSMSVDMPADRLYYVDSRAGTIHSCHVDGYDKRILRAYATNEERALQLAVHDDLLYIVGVKGNLWHMHKHTQVETNRIQLDGGFNTRQPMLIINKSIRNKMPDQYSSECAVHKHSACHAESVCIVQSEQGGTSCMCAGGTQAMLINDQLVCHTPNQLICMNQGSSVNGTCLCAPGFGGSRCEHSLCHNRCLNQGECLLNINTDTIDCRCAPEYDGARCERYKCAQSCGAFGQCRVAGNGLPVCHCAEGYTGLHCEHTANCTQQHCHNNGICRQAESGVMFCECVRGSHGRRCELCGDSMDTNQIQCANGAICTDGKCICELGFSGMRCENDSCHDHCFNGGTCVRGQGSVSCECPPGYSGTQCEIDSCQNRCSNNGTCVHHEHNKLVTSPVCLCAPGYTGPQCTQRQSCQEFCSHRALHCYSHNDDVTLPYTCVCKTGYVGHQCEQTQACHLHCRNGATCNNTQPWQTPTCHCPDGLGGERCDRVSASSCASLPCANGGLCTRAFNNKPSCMCLVGWTGLVCNLPSCANYCEHNAQCYVHASKRTAFCVCHESYTGDRCQFTKHLVVGQQPAASLTHNLRVFLLSFFVFVSLVSLLIVVVVLYKRRYAANQLFAHARMLDDESALEHIDNPAFMHGEVDDTDNTDNVNGQLLIQQVTNFSNPVYDSVYNDTVHRSGDEVDDLHTQLLHSHEHNHNVHT